MILLILLHLPVYCILRIARCNRTLHGYIQDDQLWAQLLSRDYCLAAQLGSSKTIYMQVYGSRMLLIGGYSEHVLSSVLGFSDDFWIRKQAIPVARFSATATIRNNSQVIVACGMDAAGDTTIRLFVYDILQNHWRKFRPSLPFAVQRAFITCINDRLFVFGASVCSGLPLLLRLNMNEALRWTELPPMPQSREGAAYGVYGDKVFIVGGFLAWNLSDTVDCFDTRTNSWNFRCSRMPIQCAHASAVVHGKYLYVFGGRTLSNAINCVQRYDMVNDVWTIMSAMPTARWNTAAAMYRGRIYVLGGETDTDTVSSVEIYTPETDRWTMGPKLPYHVHGASAVSW